ncbi:MAG: TetR/AcrR family transcriptional regulator [Candidatus Nanopelagicales bacterium]
MSKPPKSGLRDRKRIDTRARLEDAAITLALRDGLEQTTIHAISDLAQVSPRTFFNYFDSKDSAILGVRHAELLDEQVAQFLEETDITDPIEAVVALLLSIFDSPASRPTIREDRLDLIRRHPQILASQFTQVTQTRGRLTEAAETLLSRDDRFARLPSRELSDLAEMTMDICGSGLRIAMRDAAIDRAHAQTHDLEQRAHALVRNLIGHLR